MSAYNGIPDGGPAFPRIDVEHVPKGYGHGEHCVSEQMPGMSLRDYFAAQALSGLMAATGTDLVAFVVAERCYKLADAMLKERDK